MGRKVVIYSDELYHHGVRGQEQGIRRYQNEDGSYKSGAEGRYYDPVSQVKNRLGNSYKNVKNRINAVRGNAGKVKKYVKTGAIIGATLLAAYGVCRLSKNGNIISEIGEKFREIPRVDSDSIDRLFQERGIVPDKTKINDIIGKHEETFSKSLSNLRRDSASYLGNYKPMSKSSQKQLRRAMAKIDRKRVRLLNKRMNKAILDDFNKYIDELVKNGLAY